MQVKCLGCWNRTCSSRCRRHLPCCHPDWWKIILFLKLASALFRSGFIFSSFYEQRWKYEVYFIWNLMPLMKSRVPEKWVPVFIVLNVSGSQNNWTQNYYFSLKMSKKRKKEKRKFVEMWLTRLLDVVEQLIWRLWPHKLCLYSVTRWPKLV